VDRLVLKTMARESPKAQISGAKSRIFANALRSRRGYRSTWPRLGAGAERVLE